MPLNGQREPPGRAPVQQGLRPFLGTRERESSTNWRGWRVSIWECSALSNTAKAVSDIPEIYSSHLLPQLKSFKEFTAFLQAPHYKTIPALFVFALGTHTAGITWTHAAQIQRIEMKDAISL